MAIGWRALVVLFFWILSKSVLCFLVLFPVLKVKNAPLVGMLGGYVNMSDCALWLRLGYVILSGVILSLAFATLSAVCMEKRIYLCSVILNLKTMSQKIKQTVIARWDFGTIAVDIIGGVGREVARYWFRENVLYVGFVVDRIRGHAVLFFAGMSPYVFYVPDLRPHDTIECRFNDWLEVEKAIAEFEETKTK